jgi:Domain of unknown function (DUF4386)
MSTIAQHQGPEILRERGLTMGQVERWAPIGGILFVVLMVSGSFLVSDVPKADAPQQEITNYLADGGNHTRNIVGAYLWVIGALAFLWFLTRLRSDLRKAEGEQGALSTLAFGAGVAFAAVWMVSAVGFSAVAYAVELRDAPITDPDLVRALPAAGGWLLLLGGGFAGLLVLLAVSGATLRTGVYPRWLGWLGIVAAIALLFDVLYLNILPFWVWVFIAAIVMLRQPEERAPRAAS